MKKIIERFSLYDIIVIAMMAALGVAVKVVLVPLTQIITSSLFIPGGTLAGGIYMMFIVLGYAIVKKRFTALLICIVQTIMVMATGTLGSHGIMSVVTYILPGLGVEILFLFTRFKAASGKPLTAFECFGGGIVANTIGAVMVNFVFFSLPPIPLLLMACTGALSGGLGGLLAYALFKQVNRFSADRQKEEAETDIDIATDQGEQELESRGKAPANGENATSD